MNCNRYQESLSAFLDGNCGDQEAEMAFAHCGTCASCRDFLREAIALEHDLRALPLPAVPPELDRRVLRIPALEKPGGWKARLAEMFRGRMHVPVPAFAGAFGLLLMTLGVMVWLYLQRGNVPQQEVVYMVSAPTVEVYGIRTPPQGQ